MGGEWLVKQAYETLEMDDNLAEIVHRPVPIYREVTLI
jgi:hypothetical protein